MFHELTDAEVRAFIYECKNRLAEFEKSMYLIIEHRLWLKAGYPSFERMWTAVGFDNLKISRPLRQQILTTMKSESPEVSSHTLAKIVGASQSTVNRELRNIESKDSTEKAEPQVKPHMEKSPVDESQPENPYEGVFDIVEPRPPIPRCPTCGKPS